MGRRRAQRKGFLYRRGPSWFLQYRVDTDEVDERGKFKRKVLTSYVAPAAGPGKVSRREAGAIAHEEYLAKLDQVSRCPQSMKTVAQFVKERFEPDVVWSCKPSGQEHYRNMIKNHVLPALGTIRLRDVKPQDVQDLIRAKLASGAAVQTAKHVKNTVRAIFRHAKRLKAFAGDLPTEGVRLPKPADTERRALTWEQVKLVAAHMGRPDLEALVIVLSLTGLRIGEAMGLRWKRLNLEEQAAIIEGELLPGYTLAVRENFVRNQYGTLKTKRSKRNVPMSSEVWYQLTRLKMATKYCGPDDPVWSASNGRPLDRHNLSNRNLKRAGKLAGVPWVGFHTFRHTAATLADQAGLSVTERQRILGHATAEMTLAYSHAEHEGSRSRIENMGRVQ